jgi:Zn-finger nucleic acid-binding protein
MRSYERNGVHIEQCSDCRGLFLDRGELERLVEAEGSFYQPSSPSPQRQDEHESSSYSHGGKQYKKRRKNFLEELFD